MSSQVAAGAGQSVSSVQDGAAMQAPSSQVWLVVAQSVPVVDVYSQVPAVQVPVVG